MKISRKGRKPYHIINDAVVIDKQVESIVFQSARLDYKFLGNTMLLYWIREKYFALVCTFDMKTGWSRVIMDEIDDSEVQFVVVQLNAIKF